MTMLNCVIFTLLMTTLKTASSSQIALQNSQSILNLQVKMFEIETSMEALNDTIDEELTQFTDEVTDIKNASDALARKGAALEKQITAMEMKNDQLEQAVSALEMNNTNLEQTVGNLEQLKQTVGNLEQALEACNCGQQTDETDSEILDEIVKEIKDQNVTDQQINHLIQTHEGYIDSIQNVNMDQKQQITALQGTVSSLQNTNTAQQTQISSLESAVSSLQGKMNSISTLQNTNTAQQTQISSLESAVSSLQGKLNSMQTSLNTVLSSVGVRLVGGDWGSYGAVEVTYNGRPGWLCDDYFDHDNNGATVVCRMLGFSSGSYADGNDFVSNPGDVFLLDNVNCSGNEASLALCQHNAFGQEDCASGELAGVRCS